MNIKLFLIDVLKSTAEEVKGIKGKLLRDVDGLDNALKNLMSGGKIYLLSLSLSLSSSSGLIKDWLSVFLEEKKIVPSVYI